MEIEKREWLTELSGLAIAQKIADEKRQEKDLKSEQFSAKVVLAKEIIRDELTIKLKKNKGFGSIKTLDETGTQLDEFDISDFDDFKVDSSNLIQMSAALQKVERIASEMRNAMTEKIDAKTGEPMVDDKGNVVMVPLYTDEEIIEEVYMPLVRERIIPESLVPGRFSKTQEMIDASDKLYKARLEKYTEETESDPDFSEDVKIFGEKMFDIASEAAKMFPGNPELASTAIQLAKVGFSTSITAYQMINADEWQGMACQVIDGVGKVVSGIVTATVGKDVGDSVQTFYNIGAVGPKCIIHLSGDEPAIDKFCNVLADGLDAALGQAIPNADEGQKAIITAACNCLKNAGTGVNIAKAAKDGNKQEIIKGLGEISQRLLKDAMNIAKASGGTGEANLDDIEEKVSQGLKIFEAGAQLTVLISDGVKAKKIKSMAQDIIDALGDILTTTTGAFAPPEVAKQIGGAYTATTSLGMVAYHLSLEEPDPGAALAALAKGFGGAMTLACPDDKSTAKQIGDLIEKGIATAGKAVDFAKLIKEEKYSDAVKKCKSIADTVISTAFGLAPQSGDLTEEELKEIQSGIETGVEGLSEMADEIAKLKDSMNAEDAKEKLEAAVMELRGQQALESIASERDEVRRALVQRDESGKAAASERAIDNLINQMVKDRMMMELGTKLVSGGVGTVAKFVPVLGAASVAIDLATNLMKAADRAIELNKWLGNQKDMEKAQSSFSSSAKNFVKNQAEQFSYYAIQSALKLAELIGEVLKCSGIASAAGEAVSKTAALASVAAEAVRDFAKKVDLEKSWKITKKAWAHPESRKLQLIARSMNPTLAKYTLAWGAVEKNDPLAMEAMATCGLNELTLSDEKSNVDKVQKYLEVMFSEDNVVLKRIPTPEWAPKTVELTTKCWILAKTKGIKLAKLKDEQTGWIDESVSTLETAIQELEAKEKVVESTRGPSKNDMLGDLQTLRAEALFSSKEFKKALNSYTPRISDAEKTHHEMQEFLSAMHEQADIVEIEVEAAYDETDNLLEYISMQRLFA